MSEAVRESLNGKPINIVTLVFDCIIPIQGKELNVN